MTSLTFTAPLPPHELSPNHRCHWAKKARAVAQYRRDVGFCLLAAVGVGNVPHFERASVSLEFVFPTAQRHDVDNLTASWKAGFDGLTDCHIWPDDSSDRMQIAGVTCRKAAQGEEPCVVLTIDEVPA